MSKKKKIIPLNEEQKKLVEANLPYAVWYAYKSVKKDSRLDFQDLREVTYCTLVEAAAKYDPNKSKDVNFFGFLRVLTERAVIDFMRRQKTSRSVASTVRIEDCASVPFEGNENLWEAIN